MRNFKLVHAFFLSLIGCIGFTKSFAGNNQIINQQNHKTDTTKLPIGQGMAFTYPNIPLEELKKATPYQLLLLHQNESIISYTFTTDLPSGAVVTVKNNGGAFSSTTLDIIYKVKPGNLISIDNIVISENGKSKKIPAKIWYVK